MAESEELDRLCDNGLTGLTLEDAMITFAFLRPVRVYREISWNLFKSEYQCTETYSELFDKFWNEIIPNLNDYEIARNSPLIADTLSSIPNPWTFPSRVPKTYEHVTLVSETEMRSHMNKYNRLKDEITQQRIWNDPELLALKAHCQDSVEELFAGQSRHAGPSRESGDSLPPVRQSMATTRNSPLPKRQSMVPNAGLDSRDNGSEKN